MGTFPAISQFLLITFEGNKRKTKFPLPQNIASYFPVVIYNCLALTSWYIFSDNSIRVFVCKFFFILKNDNTGVSSLLMKNIVPVGILYSQPSISITGVQSVLEWVLLLQVYTDSASQIPFFLIQFKIRYQILFD